MESKISHHPNAFLSKTFEMFSAPAHSEYCGWTTDGDAIVVHKSDYFEREILPKYFTNRATFVRQLNKYGFQKCSQNSHDFTYSHPQFKRNQPDLLLEIKRQPSGKGRPDNGSEYASHHKSTKRTSTNTSLNEQDISPLQSVSSSSADYPPQQWNMNQQYQQHQQQQQQYQQAMNQPSNSDPNTQFVLIPNSSYQYDYNQQYNQQNNNQHNNNNMRFQPQQQQQTSQISDSFSLTPSDDWADLNNGHYQNQQHDHNNHHKRMRTDSFSSLGSFDLLDNVSTGMQSSSHSHQEEDQQHQHRQVTNEHNTNNDMSDNIFSQQYTVTPFHSQSQHQHQQQVQQSNQQHYNQNQNHYTNSNNNFNNNSTVTTKNLDSITQELTAQRALLQHHIRAMNHKMNLVQNENYMLKHMFVEGHKKNVMLQERLDLVLKAIYNMYTSNTSSSQQASQLMQQLYALFNSNEGGGGGGQFSVGDDFNVNSSYQQMLLLQDGSPTDDTLTSQQSPHSSLSPHDEIDTEPISSNNKTHNETTLSPTTDTPHPFDNVSTTTSKNTQNPTTTPSPSSSGFDPLALRRSDSLMEFAAGLVDDLSA